MKATGIIRRIDDLGRVIIPKEIRRTLKIREGDPLEIYVDRGAVIFQKYETMGNIEIQCHALCDTFQRMRNACAIFDRDGELFVTNTEYNSTFALNVPKLPKDLIDRHETIKRYNLIFMPIIDDGEMLGTVAVETSNREMVEFAVKNLVRQANN